jgi:hypothetical protein
MTSILNVFSNLDGSTKTITDTSTDYKVNHSNSISVSLDQGNKFNKYQNKIVHKVEKKSIQFDENVKEGFTNDLTEKTNELLSKTEITKSDRSKIANLMAEQKKALDEYNLIMEQINRKYKEYTARLSSSNPYLNKNVRFTTGHICYVTKNGVVKHYRNWDSYTNTAGQNDCPPQGFVQLDIPWDRSYNVPGRTIPTDPPLISGTPMIRGQACGSEGGNVYVNSLIGDEEPSAVGCFLDDYENHQLTYIGNKPERNSENFVNGDFMVPLLDRNSFRYINNDFDVVGWQFNAVVMNESSAWGYPVPYPNRIPQAVSIQNQHTMSQSVFLEKGDGYIITYNTVGRRSQNGRNTVFLFLTDPDGNKTKIHEEVPPRRRWHQRRIPFKIPTSGEYTISFEGQNSRGDRSTAIHNVFLNVGETTQQKGDFTFEQCKRAAMNGLYKFFSLQKLDENSDLGFCGVTNTRPLINCENEKTTPEDTNRLFEFKNVGVRDNMGKAAFIDPDGLLLPYSANNVENINDYTVFTQSDSAGNDITNSIVAGKSIDDCKNTCNSLAECYGFVYQNTTSTCFPKTSNAFPNQALTYNETTDFYSRNKKIIEPPVGINQDVSNITSYMYNKYPKGSKMLPAYGFSRAVALYTPRLDELKKRLTDLNAEIVKNTGNVTMGNHLLTNQSTANVDGLNQFNSRLSVFNNRINEIQSNNYDNIVDDAELTVLHENYTYMIWSILAIGSVLVGMNVLKN